jgi:hypothetical protein
MMTRPLLLLQMQNTTVNRRRWTLPAMRGNNVKFCIVTTRKCYNFSKVARIMLVRRLLTTMRPYSGILITCVVFTETAWRWSKIWTETCSSYWMKLKQTVTSDWFTLIIFAVLMVRVLWEWDIAISIRCNIRKQRAVRVTNDMWDQIHFSS